MKRILIMLTAGLLVATVAPAARAGEFDKYIWEFPEVTEVKLPADQQWMLDDLRIEIGKVLAAGHLAPFYINTGDLSHEGYFLYQEPGRIVTTLAWAYPYLTDEQRKKVIEYVREEWTNRAYVPWNAPALPVNEGHGREGYDKPRGFNFGRWWGMEGQHRPTLHTLYGVWLYGHRTGDWETVKKYWPDIRMYYVRNVNKGELYGQFCGHIAVARLARQFGDKETEAGAVIAAEACFKLGKSYEAVDKLAVKYYNRLPNRRYATGTSFLTMNISPEVGRFMGDFVKQPVKDRNDRLTSRWPYWWMATPPHGGTWAGNIGGDMEGVGLPREAFAMIYPVERWALGTPSDKLAGYMISGPESLGDSYWLEPLVWTIESFGQTKWTNVGK